MQDSPIGILDSGLGGLSVLREIHALLPGESLHYVGDSAWCPYGPKPVADIRARVFALTDHLLALGVKLIVVACNSATIAAVESLRAAYPIPFTGMEPAVKPAAERTRTRHVGVIATEATFQGELFAALLDRYGAQVTVHTQVCPDLVPLVEAGELDSKRARQAVKNYLAPLLAAGIDELVLGCTHYPFLRPLIEQIAGPTVEIIDPAPAVARQTQRVIGETGQTAPTAVSPQHRIYTTGDPARFRDLLHHLINVEADVQQALWIEDDQLVASAAT